MDLSFNNLVGQVPPEVGNAAQLNYLNLSSNNLSGDIPSMLGNSESLEEIMLDWNFFSGSIHYWKRVLCRGPEALPRAKSRALRKDTLCRGLATGALGKERPSAKRPLPRVRPSAKTGPRQIKSLPRAAALGKLGPLGHGGHFPSSFAEGHPLGPRQRFFFLCNQVIRQFFLSLCRGP